jgi:magnesium-transporting ATPase (P-type)
VVNAPDRAVSSDAVSATQTVSDTSQPWTLEVAQALAAFGADGDKGLSEAEASRRLAQDGPNVLRAAAPIPTWRRVLGQFQDPLIYLLLAAIGISFAAWWLEGAHGWPVDTLAVLAIVLLNGVLGYVQEARARSAVAALARLMTTTSSVVRGGRTLRVPSSSLVTGDLLFLAEGDAVGADARLTTASSLRVQEASLTGESHAVSKVTAALGGEVALGDRSNMVFKGTAVSQGVGHGVVCATGMATEMGSIAKLLDATAEKPTPLQQEVARLGRRLSAAVLVVAVIVVGATLIMFPPSDAAGLVEVLLLGVALAVAAVPEGLPAVLSVVLALGVQRLARRSAIVKKLSSVETLGCASVICSDKTGTLTRAEMTIEKIITASGETHVTGVGYAPEGQVLHGDSPMESGGLRDEQALALEVGARAGNSSLRQTTHGVWEIQGDPTEAAFLVAERKLAGGAAPSERYKRLAEIPFTSERRMMSVVLSDSHRGGATVLYSKGAPGVLLEHCTHERVGREAIVMDSAARARILAGVGALSDAALRTLAVASRDLDAGENPGAGASLESRLVYDGVVGMIDPPRAEALDAIREARGAGIRTIMVTGDHPRTAARIAADLGIASADAAVLTGLEIDALDAEHFAAVVRTTNVYARVTPAHKLRIVLALQAAGEIVAVTGDGVNDAPALKAADIGIAMGKTGTEVSKEAARMILADDNFATIVRAVREGRNIFENIRKLLRYLLSSNTGEVLTVFLAVVGSSVIGLSSDGGVVAVPLLATQILWLNLITDSWPALAMGVDPADADVMRRRPRPRTERVIGAGMWVAALEIGLVVAAAALITMDMFHPGGLIEGHHDMTVARTAGFTVLVVAHLFQCFNARSATATAFQGLFRNGWLWGAIGLSAGLQAAVVHVPVLNVAFGTAPLTLAQWGTCVAMGSSVLWYSEVRKLVARLVLRRTATHGVV